MAECRTWPGKTWACHSLVVKLRANHFLSRTALSSVVRQESVLIFTPLTARGAANPHHMHALALALYMCIRCLTRFLQQTYFTNGETETWGKQLV